MNWQTEPEQWSTSRRGPKRTVDVGDVVRVRKGAGGSSLFAGLEGTVVGYKPATGTSWGSYVKVEFSDGRTRVYRPAEVELSWPGDDD